MNKNKIISLISPAAFLLFGIWVRYSAASMTKRDAMMPIIVAYAIIIVSIIDFITEWRKKEHKDRFAGVNFGRVGACIAAMYLYVFLIQKIGFYLDTLWLTAFTMWVLDYKNYKMLAVSAVIITTVVFVAFNYLLNVPLPTLWL